MAVRDLTGHRFGRLVALERIAGTKNRHSRWRCRCDCGAEAEVSISNLSRGQTRSCGCLYREETGNRFRTHGQSSSSTYGSWQMMWSRCTNPNFPGWRWYGGLGVLVCERWQNFVLFLADMGERPAGLTIERVDANGNYEPSNCVWATRRTQRRNQRRKKLDAAGVAEIKRRLRSGERPMDIARSVGVNSSMIGHIKSGRAWVDVA